MQHSIISASIAGIARHRIATDGDGVTTLVAFQGCTLRCRYCLNPQTIDAARHFTSFTVEQLYEKVRQDELYFLATQGGITFGGGEPALRSDYISAFRERCGNAWRITLETALNVPLHHLEQLLPVVDHYIIDIKDMNPEHYYTYTGKTNQQVVDNLAWLTQQGKCKDIMIRVPLIPNYNTQEDIEKSIALLRSMGYEQFDCFTYKH